MANATHHDAEIVIRLYELRREEVMRKARTFMVQEFWPQNAGEIVQLVQDFGSPQNAFFRQIISFCEMQASLVVRGAVNAELFSDWSGEMFFIYTKFKPFLEEVRQQTNNPGILALTEKFVNSSEENRKKIEAMEPRVKMLGEKRRGAGAR